MSDTRTVTLTEFLLARIAEDEAGWRSALAVHDGVSLPALQFGGKPWPERALAECAAKRQIVQWHQSWPVLIQQPAEIEVDPSDLSGYTMRMSQQIAWATTREYVARFGEEPPTTPTLRALASVYADHPDFRDEWRG